MSSETKKSKGELFEFGAPTPVLEGRDILDYVESWWNGEWYEPPISFNGLAKSFRANPHHSSSIYKKRNSLVSSFIPHKLLSRDQFSRWGLDYLTFGNGYIERKDNRLGGSLGLKVAPAKYVRRGREPDQYFWAPNAWGNSHEFKKGSIHHLIEPDINQEIYGLPEYLAGLNSAWLNESATLFRRRYYENGSHAGFILYMTDAAQDENYVNDLRDALKNAKGPGNFRNLFMYAPSGKKDGIQLIPIAEVAAKDEFFNIKNVTRDDILAAHRMYPILVAVVPQNAAGLGDFEKADRTFHMNEIIPLQERFKELNEWIGEEVVSFKTYDEIMGTIQQDSK